MKDLVDKSKIGLGNLIVEVLAKINPTDPLKFVKRPARRSDSGYNTRLTVWIQEKQTDKVIIDSTRSTHDDCLEDNGVRPIRV